MLQLKDSGAIGVLLLNTKIQDLPASTSVKCSVAASNGLALGKISGRGNTGLNVIYETHINALYTGIGLIVFFYIVAEILLRA